MSWSRYGLFAFSMCFAQSGHADMLPDEVAARMAVAWGYDFSFGQYEGDTFSDFGGFGDIRVGTDFQGDALGFGAQLGFRRLSFDTVNVSELYGFVHADFNFGRLSLGRPLNVLDQIARPGNIGGSPAITRATVNSSTGSFASNARLIFEDGPFGVRVDFPISTNVSGHASRLEFGDFDATSTEIGAVVVNDSVRAEFGIELVTSPVLDETGAFGKITIDIAQAGLMPAAKNAEIALSVGRSATSAALGQNAYYQLEGLFGLGTDMDMGIQFAELSSGDSAWGIHFDYEFVDSLTGRISFASLGDEEIISLEINLLDINPRPEPAPAPRAPRPYEFDFFPAGFPTR